MEPATHYLYETKSNEVIQVQETILRKLLELPHNGQKVLKWVEEAFKCCLWTQKVKQAVSRVG